MRRVWTVGVAVAGIALGGCASTSESERTARPAGSSDGVSARGGQALIEAQTAFARCMRRHGANLPDPQPGRGFELAAGAVEERRFQAAERQCARHRRAIADAAPKRSEADRERDRDAALGYARCMRARGQQVSDPAAGNAEQGTAVSVPPDAKTNPAFQAASRACGHLLREGGGS